MQKLIERLETQYTITVKPFSGPERTITIPGNMEAAQALRNLKASADAMAEALGVVKEMTQRKQLPITHQINEAVTEALAAYREKFPQ